jgi:hypothetical protein
MADNAVDRTIFVLSLPLISYLNEEKKKEIFIIPGNGIYRDTLDWSCANLSSKADRGERAKKKIFNRDGYVIDSRSK